MFTDEMICEVRDFNNAARGAKRAKRAESEMAPPNTFTVKLNVDTSELDAALEKARELWKLMGKTGILPESKDKE